MAKIVNNPTIKEEKVDIARSCIEHRAIWMALFYDEMVKAGVPNAEEITRNAIYRCGLYHGGIFKEMCAGSTDCRVFSAAFMPEIDRKEFEMDLDNREDEIHIDFHYCPLVSAWQKIGCDEERISKLCDMAMDGDRGIVAANGLKLDLMETIADGYPTCKMLIHK